ncbi:MAG: amidase family protein [Parvibaculum sp.]|nr:amidase family protein [Parvibaculum sp.]
MAISDYASYDGLGLAALVKAGDVSAAELAEEAITRIEKHNPALNAVVLKLYDLGRNMAKAPVEGAFEGVPFLLKDAFGDLAGTATRDGSRFRSGEPAKHDSTLAARFKAAGVVVLGKTNVPEYTLLPTTESALYGAACNPWNTAHSTGGSSGGAGAAVAAGLVPIAHANDSGGSIRIPASACGLVGMKPTRGRNPLGPDYGDVVAGLCSEHVLTRSVRDSAAMLDCTHGAEIGDPFYAPPVEQPYLAEVFREAGRLRIAYCKTDPDGKAIHPECAAGVEETAKLLADLGHDVEEARPPLAAGEAAAYFLPMWAAYLAWDIDAEAERRGRPPKDDELQGLTWGFYEIGKTITAGQFLDLRTKAQAMSRRIAQFMQSYDVTLSPTLAQLPVRNGVLDLAERDAMKGFLPLADYTPFTPLQNLTGQPSISLPLHWSADGLPVGMLFSGRFGDEATLFRLAAQLEAAKPWLNKHPKIWG